MEEYRRLFPTVILGFRPLACLESDFLFRVKMDGMSARESVRHTQRLSTLTQRLSIFTRRLCSFAQRLSTLTRRLGAFAQRLSTLTRRLSTLTQRLSTLTRRLGAFAQRLSTFGRFYPGSFFFMSSCPS